MASHWISVIPITFDPKQGVMILLGTGRSGESSGVLCDFGGPVCGSDTATPQSLAARVASHASNGIFGTCEDIRKSLKKEYRFKVPSQGYVYVMVLTAQIAQLIPSLFSSNLRFILNIAGAHEDAKSQIVMRRLEWFSRQDVESAVFSRDLRTISGRNLRFRKETLESLRHMFCCLQFDAPLKSIRPKTLASGLTMSPSYESSVDVAAAAAGVSSSDSRTFLEADDDDASGMWTGTKMGSSSTVMPAP